MTCYRITNRQLQGCILWNISSIEVILISSISFTTFTLLYQTQISFAQTSPGQSSANSAASPPPPLTADNALKNQQQQRIHPNNAESLSSAASPPQILKPHDKPEGTRYIRNAEVNKPAPIPVRTGPIIWG